MKKKKGRILITLGLMLIAAAALMAAYNIYDGYRARTAAREIVSYLEEMLVPEDQRRLSSGEQIASDGVLQAPVFVVNTAEAASGDSMQEDQLPATTPAPGATDPAKQDPVAVDVPKPTEIPDYILNPDMEMPVSRYNGQDYIGMLEIPALDLKLPVISQWSYPRLRIAPCRYSGSAYTNDLVISAHNYAAHFGYLNQLHEGAAVIFTDADGNIFNYRVDWKETLNPRDVEYMKESEWDLTLFTCTPGGSYRVAVRCILAKAYKNF